MIGQRTPMGRVRGLGAAKEGPAHWWAQRLTAIALVPLCLWFAAAIAAMAGADHKAATAWLADPPNAILTVLLVVALFHHAQLGVQVVVEDYVHTEWRKVAAIVMVKLVAVLAAATAVFSVLKIAFGVVAT